MAELKINQDLYLNERNLPLSNMLGDFRLIGYGKTDAFTIAASTQTFRPFGEVAIYDSGYLEIDSSHEKMYVKKTGIYMFMMKCRLADNSDNVFVKICIDGMPKTGAYMHTMYAQGAGLKRNTLFQLEGAYIEENTGFQATCWKGSAGTMKPFEVYIFAISGSDEQDTSLPNDYQEIEYLESNGTPYIDTKVKLNPTFGFDIKYYAKSPVQASSGYGCIFGGRTNSGVDDYQLTTYAQFSGGGAFRWGNSTAYTTSGGAAANPEIVQNTVQTCSMRNGVFTRPNGQTSTFGLGDIDEGSAGGYCFLFALSDNGTKTQSGSGCRIYYMKLYDNRNFMIRNYIPCRRKSDSVLGMYDTVTKYFFTNAGSGAFTAGPDIN